MLSRRISGALWSVWLGVSFFALLCQTPRTAAAPIRGTASEEPVVVAFTSARSGARSIWRLGPQVGQLQRISTPSTPVSPCGCRHGERDSHPAWSRDGRRIAFTRGARLVIARADGSHPLRVPAPAGAEDYAPAWTARGRLSFMRQRPARGGGFVHEIVTVDGGGRNATVGAPASRAAYGSFAWSNDGRRLAYTIPYRDPSFVLGLFVTHPPSARARFILRATGMGDVAWSPDDRTIVLAASVPGAEPFEPYRLFTIRLGDRRITQLTDTLPETGDGGPRWSPDGRWIAFTRSSPARHAVHVVRPNGAGERRLVADALGAAWSPSGRHLAVVEGVSGRGKPLTLSVVTAETGAPRRRVSLRHPVDVDVLGAQSWRPSAR